MTFRHGSPVTLSDPSGRAYSGTLHLPDVVMYGLNGNYTLARETTGARGVHTITRPDGSRFRTEGTLAFEGEL